ncbi:lytic transglycosylase domain-containing protein [Chitiniphilus eburneus]|uniref:lytic transglycosylase domain-containing protein n=1 Tax=Chitiniphilus eburneus TaxID=2571148 RepID=UPI0035CEAD5B
MAINSGRLGLLLLSGVAIAAVLLARRQQAGETQDSAGWFLPDIFGFMKTGMDVSKLQDSEFRASITAGRGNQYFNELESIGGRYGLPPYMLPRVAYQESRFRDDIITGKTKSSAGAAGMFQLMPVHWSAVNPLDWRAAGDYAARYLLGHFKRFGNWPAALAAYNWGQGNVAKHLNTYGALRLEKLPSETRNYVNEIMRDLGGDMNW